MKKIAISLGLALAALMSTGGAQADARVVISTPAPVVGGPMHPGQAMRVWEEGHWMQQGYQQVWVPGRWVLVAGTPAPAPYYASPVVHRGWEHRHHHHHHYPAYPAHRDGRYGW